MTSSSAHLRRIRFWLLAACFALPAMGGLLSLIEVTHDGLAGVEGLAGAIDVAVSPGGEHVYAIGQDDNALAVFSRDPTTGPSPSSRSTRTASLASSGC